jgi:hypothetical protein
VGPLGITDYFGAHVLFSTFFSFIAPERKGRMFDDNESHRTKTLVGSFHTWLLALHEDCFDV